MGLSVQQQVVVDFATSGEGHLNLIARAGCGKTFTLMEIIKAVKAVKPEAEISTVHKSKGREWDRVYILGMNKYMPSKYAKKDWELAQEKHLMYVSVTRSKSELVFIEV